ncbi:TnsD family Tn7-like transposition protein [Alteromonas sp. a30]|uniref:TnsD family Tn7-like transposition protein n=1 Tax=Alteromonas sp. a30 TaxID=2730917 RepID=UPI002280417A|nr:TnsD family Tn7-like transposition protein [Alteromonas sp. a30]MCY7294981.1 hypothetical protein [Alteromonas sp. a30]
MLNYFPKPYPHEMLFSILGRCYAHLGINQHKPFLDDLYQDRHVIAVADLPCHIQRLHTNIQSFWDATPEEIIKQHTHFPLYAPFIGLERRTVLINAMLSDSGVGIHTQTGMTASIVKPVAYFRYCPLCLAEMKRDFGEYYWDIRHQISGANVCSKHNVLLLESNKHFRPKSRHLYSSCRIQEIGAIVKNDCDKSLELTKRILTLLSNQSSYSPTLWQWTLFYKELAAHKNMQVGSKVCHEEIAVFMVRFWGNEYLSKFGLSINASAHSWLRNLFRKHKKAFSYLQHLMVWQAFELDSNTKNVFDKIQSYPKEKQAKVFIDLETPKKLISQKRNQWLALIGRHGDVGVKAIRSAYGGAAIYAWLYRHDKAWLADINRPFHKQGDCTHTADWAARDRILVKQLLKIERSKLLDYTCPWRSRNWYLKQLDNSSSVEHHLNELPLCKAFFIRYVESIGEYQTRRIAHAVAEAFKENIVLKRWEIERVCGLRRDNMPDITDYLLRWIDSKEYEASLLQKYPSKIKAFIPR